MKPSCLAGVVLGGGHGRRAGGPKAVKIVGGRPWWRLQVEALAVVARPVVAVLHQDAWTTLEPPTDQDLALRSDPDAAMLASLQQAIAVLPDDTQALVLPVDCPFAGDLVVTALRAATHQRPDWLAARPVVFTPDGVRGGHPLLLSEAGLRAVAALNPHTDRLDHWLHGLGAARIDVPLADTAVLANFNLDGVTR